MIYLKRDPERKFMRANEFFKAILVTGARQVGKTTMLRHLAQGQNRSYVSLDDIAALDLARHDPKMFFQMYKPPVMIDEVQYAPELFSQIKAICDESEATGLFWLTGSQQFSMMKNVRESMAGRMCIFEMFSMSKRELEGLQYEKEVDFSFDGLKGRQRIAPKTDIHDIFSYIWRGGMPQAMTMDIVDEQRQNYFNSYVNTHLMRDAAEFGGIANGLLFGKFVMACIALIGEELNYKTLAEASEIAQSTAKEWVRLLQGMGIIYLLMPYANNSLKRLSKTPKLYFLDSGLAASLSRWPSYETMMNSPMSGHYFENFAITEFVKNQAYSPARTVLSYYRDHNAKEIDLIVEEGRTIHPIAIKKTAKPDFREVRKFEVLDNAEMERGEGGIVCMCEEPVPIDGKNCLIPCSLI